MQRNKGFAYRLLSIAVAVSIALLLVDAAATLITQDGRSGYPLNMQGSVV